MGIEEDILQFPNSVWCETSLRNRPIPQDCECEYCKARRKLGWIVCPECEFVSDGIIGVKWRQYDHYEECSMYVDNIHRNSIPFRLTHHFQKTKPRGGIKDSVNMGLHIIGPFINWNDNPLEGK